MRYRSSRLLIHLRGGDGDFEYRMLTADGTEVWVHDSVNVVSGDDGRTVLRGFMLDITERRRAEQALVRRKAEFEAMFNSLADAVIYTDCERRIVMVNPGVTTIFGYGFSELLGQSTALLYARGSDFDEQGQRRYHLGQGAEQQAYEMEYQRNDGTTFVGETLGSKVMDGSGKVLGFIAIIRDITERMQARERLHYLAHHDVLTKLPNRVLFADRLDHALAHARRSDRAVALLFLDLDRFKLINDTLGHDIGDRSLQVLAERLSLCVRDGDTIARLGGDEFAILLEDIVSADDVAPTARKILEALSHPVVLEDRELFVTTSIGISLFPSDGRDSQALLKHADIAMYRAKEQGRNTYQFYSADMSAKAFERLNLETNLRHALEREEFRLFYQPQVDINSGRVTGVEALLRWQHPDFGLVTPAQFVPLLEDTGLIVPVGEWVLRTACCQAKAWQQAGLELERIAVNLSGRQFTEPGFADLLRRITEDCALQPTRLELEITESVLMKHEHINARTFHTLEELDTRLAIDDFGTGYSSLGYLKRLPVDTLKIDRSFVRDAASDANNAAIIQAIIAMARSLELEVIAEGVETADQRAFLRGQGCSGMQGYLFSRPVEADEIAAMLNKGPMTTAAGPRGFADEATAGL